MKIVKQLFRKYKKGNIMNKEVLECANKIYEYLNLNIIIRKNKIDCMVGLGSADIGIADYCYRLSQNHEIKNIIFTGKGGKNSAFNNYSEAEKLYKRYAYLTKDLTNIFTEKEAINTYENICFVKRMFKDIGAHAIVFVGKPYQMRRCKAICDIQFKKTYLNYFQSPSYNFLDYVKYNKEKSILTLNEIIQELVDEISNLIIMPNYQILKSIKVPKKILDCYYYLLANKFHNRLDEELIKKAFNRWHELGVLNEIQQK